MIDMMVSLHRLPYKWSADSTSATLFDAIEKTPFCSEVHKVKVTRIVGTFNFRVMNIESGSVFYTCNVSGKLIHDL